MNILGIDFGTKNIGTAWMQTGINVVLPYGLITGADNDSKIKKLAELIKKENIDKLVIGLPIGLDGKENKNTERIREFAGILKDKTKISVEFINESFSSHAADRMEGGASRDEKSAMVILQSYLDRKKS